MGRWRAFSSLFESAAKKIYKEPSVLKEKYKAKLH